VNANGWIYNDAINDKLGIPTNYDLAEFEIIEPKPELLSTLDMIEKLMFNKGLYAISDIKPNKKYYFNCLGVLCRDCKEYIRENNNSCPSGLDNMTNEEFKGTWKVYSLRK
jgi:hypothetical protein